MAFNRLLIWWYTSLHQGRHIIHADMSIESFYIEMNVRKKKWLLICKYNPNKNLISNHLKEYVKTWTIIPQNMTSESESTESAVRECCEIHSCNNLIIDFVYFNYRSFSSVTFETGLSYSHKMTTILSLIILKKLLIKLFKDMLP